jgi:catechol 2,3-dioxygenase-like lactoylglutathione lyase family enzyme
MLANAPVRMSIPAADMTRARQFYAEKLGLTPVHEFETGMVYRCAGTYFTVVVSDAAGQASYSLMTWVVEDIASAMTTLRASSIVFEEFDFPWLKTVHGVAYLGDDRVAWFKDSEGNLLALAQLVSQR